MQQSAELTERDPRQGYLCGILLEVFMTLQKAKSIARHLGLTLRQLRSGNYRVNFRDGNETTATTRTNSKRPQIPRLRWPVGERCELHPEYTRRCVPWQ